MESAFVDDFLGIFDPILEFSPVFCPVPPEISPPVGDEFGADCILSQAVGLQQPNAAMMARDLAEAFAAAARGEPISVDMRLRNRRDQAFCVRLLVQAIDALFLAAGGQGLFLDKSLQRFWRDAHAAASHISLNWDSTGSMYGQFMLGLEPKGQY